MIRTFVSFSLCFMLCTTQYAFADQKNSEQAKAPMPSGAPRELEWVSLKGGTFMMGISERQLGILKKRELSPEVKEALPYEQPAHEVKIKAFDILKTEVTMRQYKKCVEAGGCSKPKKEAPFCNYGREGFDNYPINCIDWFEAHDFCYWAGGHLPSEAQWEYAARSEGQDIMFPWGDEPWPTCDYIVMDENGRGCGKSSIWPVCSKPKGNTKQGLCDMAGNSWEWVEDWFHPNYHGAPKDGSAWTTPPKEKDTHVRGKDRLIRGGGINSINDYRTTLKGSHGPEFSYGASGMRCVR